MVPEVGADGNVKVNVKLHPGEPRPKPAPIVAAEEPKTLEEKPIEEKIP
jgi:hypothetical protein